MAVVSVAVHINRPVGDGEEEILNQIQHLRLVFRSEMLRKNRIYWLFLTADDYLAHPTSWSNLNLNIESKTNDDATTTNYPARLCGCVEPPVVIADAVEPAKTDPASTSPAPPVETQTN